MSRMPKDVEEAIYKAIEAELPNVESGASPDWALVRKRWPALIGPGAATEKRFFRMVKKVRERAKPLEDVIVERLPAVPSAGAMVRAAKSGDGVNIMGMLEQLMGDSQLFRQYTVKLDADGVESIKNPVLFDTSMKRRLDLIGTYLAVYQEVHDLRQMQVFFDEIMDIIATEIAPAEPTIAKRVLERLRQLKERRDEVRPV